MQSVRSKCRVSGKTFALLEAGSVESRSAVQASRLKLDQVRNSSWASASSLSQIPSVDYVQLKDIEDVVKHRDQRNLSTTFLLMNLQNLSRNKLQTSYADSLRRNKNSRNCLTHHSQSPSLTKIITLHYHYPHSYFTRHL
jgi:hypothetical protein